MAVPVDEIPETVASLVGLLNWIVPSALSIAS